MACTLSSSALIPLKLSTLRRSGPRAIKVSSTPVASISKVAKNVEKISAAVSLSTASFVAPSFAMSEAINETAAITPSLKNTLLSVVAGGVVLAAIAAAVIGVSSFDKVTRK